MRARLRRVWARWRHTITLAVVLVLVGGLLSLWVIDGKRCKDRGGTYVQTAWSGYECIEERP